MIDCKNVCVNVARGHYFESWKKPFNVENKVAVVALGILRAAAILTILFPEMITIALSIWNRSKKDKVTQLPQIQLMKPDTKLIKAQLDVEEELEVGTSDEVDVEVEEIEDLNDEISVNHGIFLVKGNYRFDSFKEGELRKVFEILYELEDRESVTINNIEYTVKLLRSFPSKFLRIDYDLINGQYRLVVGNGKLSKKYELTVKEDKRTFLNIEFDALGKYHGDDKDLRRDLVCLNENDTLLINGKKYKVIDVEVYLESDYKELNFDGNFIEFSKSDKQFSVFVEKVK